MVLGAGESQTKELADWILDMWWELAARVTGHYLTAPSWVYGALWGSLLPT